MENNKNLRNFIKTTIKEFLNEQKVNEISSELRNNVISKMKDRGMDKRAEKWIEKLHMTEWLNTQTGAFSTGMKQRINIVRALLTKPEILFLDEPTLGLDPQTTHLIREFIRELNSQGVTVLLTTHDMIEAEALSDRVAIIDHGKIVTCDTVENLKKLVKNKPNPTLEDVFLKVTGTQIRDMAKSHVASSGMHGRPQAPKRVR